MRARCESREEQRRGLKKCKTGADQRVDDQSRAALPGEQWSARTTCWGLGIWGGDRRETERPERPETPE
ncbi:hypothetical protein Syun_009546 [Stephania yunnanensis]|uniref:Uncharacterized protein n=1 Tax=Stephania yunnanensis TaxID=152371 RepID=A0AAP0PP50_9MAGN